MRKWLSPSGSFDVRTQDAQGSGLFGASRDGGKRTHNGLDIIISSRQTIVSPTDCRFDRYSYPYATDFRWRGAWFDVNNTYRYVIWYIVPYFFTPGEEILEGEGVGIAQDISLKYGAGMTPHIHFGVQREGIWIDPMELLQVPRNT